MALRLLTLSAVMAGAASAIELNLDDFDCPDNWSVNTIGNSDDYYCCWGAGHINGEDGYCCVNNISTGGNIDPDDEIFSDCFPFCESSDSDDNSDSRRKRAPSTDLCAEKVPFSASDYSERVSAASKSVMSNASGSATDSPASTTAEATNSSGDSATTTGGDSDGATETGESSGKTNSDNAVGPLPTGDAMVKLGGAMAAAAMFAL